MPSNPNDAGTGPPPLRQVLERLDDLEVKLDSLRRERDPDQLLTEDEAADLLGVTGRTLQTMRAAGEIQCIRVRSAVRYSRSTVRAYIRRRAGGEGR